MSKKSKSFTDLDASFTLIESKNPNITSATPAPEIVCSDFSSSNWIQNFAPQTIADLAIHPKKIEEIQDWFNRLSQYPSKAQILLVTGPSGVGKTETIKLVAKSLNFELSEWITPMDIDLVNFGKYDGDDGHTFRENQTDKFKEFLFKSSRYASLFSMESKRVLLVEDFPNIFLRKSEGFNAILE